MNLFDSSQPHRDNTRLLATLAEELKLPLQQIAHKAQLAQLDSAGALQQTQDIEAAAKSTLRLVDSYLFTTQVLLNQKQLSLEPISVKAIMYDTAQYMVDIARLYDCDIDIVASNKTSLVMGHADALRSALLSLAYTLITSSVGENRKIVFRANRNKQMIQTGVVSTSPALASKSGLNNARQLYGRAHQPFAAMTHTSGAGLFVADTLFAAMESELQVGKHRGQTGFFGAMLPSKQLSLL